MNYTWNDPSLKCRRQELRRNQTDAEKALWKRLRARQLLGAKFFRQYSVGAYILDFYCPKAKLAIEIDGGQHSYEENRLADELRTRYLNDNTIRVLRFWNHEVLQQIDAVVTKISEEIPALNPRAADNSP